MPAPNEITPQQLFRLIGTADAPDIFDVCLREDFEQDPRIIPGATRQSHLDLTSSTSQWNGRHVVVSCWQGKKLSQGTAAYLRSCGAYAEYLQGGNQGWAGRELPMIPLSKIPFIPHQNTLWVTRHRPRVDRIACAWLIRRFVDQNARFLFVTPSEVLGVADRFSATPFDVENTFWGHRGVAGEFCTFDTMVDEFGLHCAALDRLAIVVRAADTNRQDLHPAAAGLLAMSVGLSRQYKDDIEQLNAAMPLYDALYRWARDGFEEEHSWASEKKQ
ncbi:MAG: chromate resistance protein ChrB domain-containing protein [Halocynthiibacter sp.]